MNPAPGQAYTSASQKARRITEAWAAENLYCPFCGNGRIERFPNNHPVADFYCPVCRAEFELKSSKRRFGRKISGGAYDSMIERLRADNRPHFLLLEYTAEWSVRSLRLIPRYFITEDMIERRKPLRPGTKRAGWVGCNVLWRNVPENGCIPVVQDENLCPKNEVRRAICDMGFDAAQSRVCSGWQQDVLDCIGRIAEAEFSLRDVYAFADELSQKHPNNRHVRDKIRQMLQVLRDLGCIEFLGEGMYRKKNTP